MTLNATQPHGQGGAAARDTNGRALHPDSTTNRPARQAPTRRPAQIRSLAQPLYVPDELAQQPRWVNWRYTLRAGKATKVPVNPRSGRNAATDRPSTWGALDDALAHYQNSRDVSGIGYNQRGTDVVGVDLDNCLDAGGNLAPWAAEIVSQFGTYTEISPSGRGIRMFGRGRKPGQRERSSRLPGVELYDGDSTRYLTFTGAHVPGTPLDVVDVTAPLADLYGRMFGDVASAAPTPPPAQPVNLDDAELIARAIAAKNGARFAALWSGDRSAHSSASEADYALVGALLFWTAGDVARADRLFRSSGLMRDKWDRRTGERTYGALTIAKCAAGQTQYYTPPRPRPANVTAVGEVAELPTVADVWRVLDEHITHDGPHCETCGRLVTYERETATTVTGGVRCFRCKRRNCLDWQVFRAKQIVASADVHTWPAHYVTKLPLEDYNRLVDRGLLRDLAQWFAAQSAGDVVTVASSEALGPLSIATTLDALAPMMARAWLDRAPGTRLRDPKKAARAKRAAVASETPKPAAVVAAVEDDPVIAQRRAAFGLIDLAPRDVYTLLDVIEAAGGAVDRKRRRWEYPVELKSQVRALVGQWAAVAGLDGRLEINAYPSQPTEFASISSAPPLPEQPGYASMTAGQRRYARLVTHGGANRDTIAREVARL